MKYSLHMAVSVLTSHVLGPAKLIFNAGGFGPAKFNIRTDSFAKYIYIYIWSPPHWGLPFDRNYN